MTMSLNPQAMCDVLEIQTRSAQSDDLEEMAALLQILFSIEADFEVDAARQRRGLQLMLDGCGKHRCIKVAEADGKVVGMCTAQILVSTAEGSVVALIEDMVVASAYRRVGIGRRLMADIEAWARAQGATRLQLLADRTNFDALDFYDRLGWRPTRLICLRRKWPVNGLPP